ncbi:MAG: hypothetical protein VX519_03095 [Myxococcota bacterium]|nr:hypothetical protein [Myxococcota bacterium]
MVQKSLVAQPISPPPVEQRAKRNACPPAEGERPSRYTLPSRLISPSVVGYRTRVSLSQEEAQQALCLLCLPRPEAFLEPESVTEQDLFEESALGVMTSRQSTNFQGHRQVTLGPEDSTVAAELLRELVGLESDVLDNAAYTHIVLTRPYRTPFTLLLTFIGHAPFLSLATVPWRALQKRFAHVDDIPTIGYLQHLHLGILADGMERAALIASQGTRTAQILQGPFSNPAARIANQEVTKKLEVLCGLTASERSHGWRIGLVAQVGRSPTPVSLPQSLWRKLGANLLAFRSERIQPGVNQEDKAPAAYQKRQDMHVTDEFAVMAGRAAYNAFQHWTGCEREKAKELLLLDRIDVLRPGGKEKLRTIREQLGAITDRLIERLPLWADLPTGKAFSRNANRGRKAFALAGQRIYIGGLSRQEIQEEGIDWELAVRALGAGAARSSLYCELMGCVDLPDDCDLLAGMCVMAGPVNQNDIGKQFYGYKDLLAESFEDRDPTSLLLWTLKAKTITDPIGNEEQLLSKSRKGALVDLRPGPHEIITIRTQGHLKPMRRAAGRVNGERAFSDVGNFVVSPQQEEIPGNRGSKWPARWRDSNPWEPNTP